MAKQFFNLYSFFAVLYFILGIQLEIVYAQTKPEYSISIEGSPSFSHLFYIDIYKFEDFIKINFSKSLGLDSTESKYIDDAREQLLAFSSDSLKAFKNDAEKEALQDKMWELLADFRTRFYVFEVDSIIVPIVSNPYYYQLLDKVVQTDTAILGRDMSIKKGEFKVVLDGTLFLIKTSKPKRRFGVRSPSVKSHPTLYSLITQTLRLYGKDHRNSFMSRDSLGAGY